MYIKSFNLTMFMFLNYSKIEFNGEQEVVTTSDCSFDVSNTNFESEIDEEMELGQIRDDHEMETDSQIIGMFFVYYLVCMEPLTSWHSTGCRLWVFKIEKLYLTPVQVLIILGINLAMPSSSGYIIFDSSEIYVSFFQSFHEKI